MSFPQILVDADASPVIPQVVEAARRYRLPLVLLCDEHHLMHSDYAQVRHVSSGADAVDIALMNLCRRGDLVVTQDYGVAAMALGKGAYAIHHSGRQYTDENMNGLLMARHLARRARRASGKQHLHGPTKYTEDDRKRFAAALEVLIEMMMQSSGG